MHDVRSPLWLSPLLRRNLEQLFILTLRKSVDVARVLSEDSKVAAEVYWRLTVKSAIFA